MIDTRLRKTSAAVALVCLVLGLCGTAPAFAATHPTVVSGTHAANIAIPSGPLATMASLPLPSGRWFVIAKAMLSGVATVPGTYSVTCRLTTGADFDVALATPAQAGQAMSRLPIVLTTVHRFSSPGQAVLGCAAHVAGSAVIGQISVQAIKLGKFTNGPIGSLGTSSGSGSPVVISAFRDAALFTSAGTFSTPQDLPLPQGRWMIVAKASVSGAQQGNFLSVIQCRVAGMSGSSQLFGDLVLGELTPIGNSASRMVMALQVAGTFGPSGGVARFECASQNTGHGFSWLKITAMRLGSLTQRDLDAGTSTTSGSGTPRVIHATQNGTNAISLPKTSFKTIAQTSLGAGKWIVRANAWIQAQGGAMPMRVECKLVGSNTNLSSFSMSPAFLDGPLWMQIAHSSGSATDVRLRCKRVGSGWSFRFVLVHITAMRVGTLTNFSI